MSYHVPLTSHDNFKHKIHPSSPLDTPSAKCLVVSSPNDRSLIPLGPSKLIAGVSHKKAVFFSPRNDTKTFNANDIIYQPSNPPSIRSYRDQIPSDSPTSSSSPSSPLPTEPRSILKSRCSEIRVAASVEEGTLNNKEAARLVVCGKRPKLLTRDSFQLAMIRKAAADSPRSTSNLQKGSKTDGDSINPSEEIPGSDDSVMSDGDDTKSVEKENDSSEEEEPIEEDGALATSSLVEIILDGAEDLLTLEEAYTTLTMRLRQRMVKPSTPISSKKSQNIPDSRQIQIQDFDIDSDALRFIRPIRDEVPAMVRALQRDLQRLLGKVPNGDTTSNDGSSSPFRSINPLLPIRTSTPNRMQPTPSPTPKTRQGFSEAEVRYRREASGVGSAALRLLALIFTTKELYSCFSEADLQALLEHVLIIPRTPKMPTPNPKRTYYLAIVVLAQMRIPQSSVQPTKDKVVRAVEAALEESFSLTNGVGEKGISLAKKESFSAVVNLISNYPSIFYQHYSELLPVCIHELSSTNILIRNKAASVISAFAAAKLNLLSEARTKVVTQQDGPSKDSFLKLRAMIQKSEFFVVAQLKTARKDPSRPGVLYSHSGERRTEWSALEQMLKDTVSNNHQAGWACSTWAGLVTLMGGAYNSSGLARDFDHIIDRSLQASTNTVRPILARSAWNHAIHSYLSSGSFTSVSDTYNLIQSYKPFSASGQQDPSQRLDTIMLPFRLSIQLASVPAQTTFVEVPNPEGGSTARGQWRRAEKSKKQQWMIVCGKAAIVLVYAFSGICLTHQDQPAKESLSISGIPSSDGMIPANNVEETRLELQDKVWEKVVKMIIGNLAGLQGLDELKLQSWGILRAITSVSIENTTSIELERDTTVDNILRGLKKDTMQMQGNISSQRSKWDLDRILTKKYICGEFYYPEKDKDMTSSLVLAELEREGVRVEEIPSWGAKWVTSRLEEVLGVFQDCLSGIRGLNNYNIVQTTDIQKLGTPLHPVNSNIPINSSNPVTPTLSHTFKNTIPNYITLSENIPFPLDLSITWKNILLSLKSTRNESEAQFNKGLTILLRHLVQIFNYPPDQYLPMWYQGQESSLLNLNSVRIGLISHLVHMMIQVLGKEVFCLPLILPNADLNPVATAEQSSSTQLDLVISKLAFGHNTSNQATLAGSLLGQILRIKLTGEITFITRKTLRELSQTLLDIACLAPNQGKLLGDLTNCIPFIFQDQELQLDVWRMLVMKWVEVVDLNPSTTIGGTNYTGGLLFSLLSLPFKPQGSVEWFRGVDSNTRKTAHENDNEPINQISHDQTTEVEQGQVNENIHENSTEKLNAKENDKQQECEILNDLQIWSNLLRTTILRFRAKRVGTNMGVLESLAGHLNDYLTEETIIMPMTIKCLTEAIRWVDSGLREENVVGQINETVVPENLLELVDKTLRLVYASRVGSDWGVREGNVRSENVGEEDEVVLENATSEQNAERRSRDNSAPQDGESNIRKNTQNEQKLITSAASELLSAVGEMIIAIPSTAIYEVLRLMKESLSIWLADDSVMVVEEDAVKLDNLYISILSSLLPAFESGHITLDSTIVNALVDIYAPRLSLAQSAEVPKTFQKFWNMTFGKVENLEYSPDVKEFLRDLSCAIPGMIQVQGLDLKGVMSEEESLSKYPHSQSLRTTTIIQVDNVERPLVPITTEDVVTPNEVLPELDQSYDADVSQTPSNSQPVKSAPVQVNEPSSHHHVLDPEAALSSEVHVSEADITTSNVPTPQSDPGISGEHEIPPAQPEVSVIDHSQTHPLIHPSVTSSSDTPDLVEEATKTNKAESHTDETVISETTNSQLNHIPTSSEGDVFGPTKIPKIRDRRDKRRSKRSHIPSSHRGLSRHESLPSFSGTSQEADSDDEIVSMIDPDVSPVKKQKPNLSISISAPFLPTSDQDQNTKEGQENHVQQEQYGKTGENVSISDQRQSFISSATRWLGRIPSLGGLFSPALEQGRDPISRSSYDTPSQDVVQSSHGNDDEESIPSSQNSVSRKRKRIPFVELPTSKRQRKDRSALSRSSSSTSIGSCSRSKVSGSGSRSGTYSPPTTQKSGSFTTSSRSNSSIKLKSRSSSSIPTKSRASFSIDIDSHSSTSTKSVSRTDSSSFSSRSSRAGSVKDEPIAIDSDEEEDELLLSPESAARFREEAALELELERINGDNDQPPSSPSPPPRPLPSRGRNVSSRRSLSNTQHRLGRNRSSQSINVSQTSMNQENYHSSSMSDKHTSVTFSKNQDMGKSTSSTSSKLKESDKDVSPSLSKHEEKGETQSSGRFDDAPETIHLSPLAQRLVQARTALPADHPYLTSPIRRTGEQTRVLRMVEEAAQAKDVVEGLDWDGLLVLMENVELLRRAATKNLREKVKETERLKKGM
ncbi:hypothetical protein M231_06579 [Tremella mesenterica]|uniref:Telomere-associated protein Rif1 N-terminal domain-containing protein n=1 Tax=Tremella mesenterica TaxID=5217 RepID=A0A4Q1BE10_TREME|nr:hypothetical protein M231_06579 [Tremella mesenterica]